MPRDVVRSRRPETLSKQTTVCHPEDLAEDAEVVCSCPGRSVNHPLIVECWAPRSNGSEGMKSSPAGRGS